MATPTPVRGLCEVSQVERIVRQQTKNQDFKFKTDTKVTIQDACDIIDEAYDRMILELDTGGIITPIINSKVLNYVKIMNAYLAAAIVRQESRVMTKTGDMTIVKTFEDTYEKLKQKLIFEYTLPDGTTNDQKPITKLEDAIYSTTADLYDTSTLDIESITYLFDMDKEF